MPIADDILAATKSVTKEWTKQRKADERRYRSRASRQYLYSDRVNFTDVAHKILPAGYDKASGGGSYTVAKRMFFYAVREQFLQATGRKIEYAYFANTLLVQYMNRHPETNGWKVTADPRGNLVIPNTGHEVRIPCGTLDIEGHLRNHLSPDLSLLQDDIEKSIATEWPSLAPGHRYQGVLYIEKEGFNPMLQEARIGQRFDLAILSCKGQSVVAARKFVDHVCNAAGGVPLFVVHDFDKAGFEICQRLTEVSDWALWNDRVTYEFMNEIDVTDLGLRLEDVETYGLASEQSDFNGLLPNDFAGTDDEREFLESGKRVELNAFTAPQFIEWLESKLTEHLPKRLIPNDETIAAAYRRACMIAKINAAIEEILDEDDDEYVTAPDDLREQLESRLASPEAGAWDAEIYKIVTQG